jgi:DNA-binding MarR family transcriptional regulator
MSNNSNKPTTKQQLDWIEYNPGEWTQIPFNQFNGLPAKEQVTLLWLIVHKGSENTCFPSHKTLAEKSGISESSVRRSIASLRERGFIKMRNRKTKDGGYTSNEYIILIRKSGSHCS